MVNPPELLEATCHSAAGTVRSPTQVVPANHRRSIYWFRAINDPTSRTGTVGLRIQHITSGGTVQDKDTLQFTTLGETQIYPDELKRDSLPLWVYTASCITRFQAVGGTVRMRFLYAEEME